MRAELISSVTDASRRGRGERVGVGTSRRRGRGGGGRGGVCALTELAHFENLAQHLGQLDAAAAKGTLVFVLPAAVLQDDLDTQTLRSAERAAAAASGSPPTSDVICGSGVEPQIKVRFVR